MDKLIKLFTIKPHWVFFIFSGVLLFAGIVNYQSSIIVKDYIETQGEIRNVEKVSVLWHQQYVTRYNFEVVWYSDGEEYVKHFEEQFDLQEEGPITIWVSPDNQKVVLHDSQNISKDIFWDFILGGLAGIVGLIILIVQQRSRKETRQERMERLENRQINSILFFIICLLLGITFGIFVYKDYKKYGYINPFMFDVVILSVVLAILCITIFFVTRAQLKRK